MRLPQRTGRREPAIRRRCRRRQQLRPRWCGRQLRLVEPLRRRSTCHPAQAIRRELTDEQAEPGAQIGAGEAAQPSEIVLQQQQPEVSEHVVNFVVSQLAVADLANRLA